MSHHTLLCLGDSYTIGEGLPHHESFPYQLLQLLRADGHSFHAPEIIAQNGWTTFELKDHLTHTLLLDKYDFVTLLIGVNNQYRNLSAKDYQNDFEFLLNKAVSLANLPTNVVVISIPDWGITPFAEGRDATVIANEINDFNYVNKEITDRSEVHYVNITPGTREAANDSSLLASDKLHPSAKAYKKWAELVKEKIVEQIKN